MTCIITEQLMQWFSTKDNIIRDSLPPTVCVYPNSTCATVEVSFVITALTKRDINYVKPWRLLLGGLWGDTKRFCRVTRKGWAIPASTVCVEQVAVTMESARKSREKLHISILNTFWKIFIRSKVFAKIKFKLPQTEARLHADLNEANFHPILLDYFILCLLT